MSGLSPPWVKPLNGAGPVFCVCDPPALSPLCWAPPLLYNPLKGFSRLFVVCVTTYLLSGSESLDPFALCLGLPDSAFWILAPGWTQSRFRVVVLPLTTPAKGLAVLLGPAPPALTGAPHPLFPPRAGLPRVKSPRPPLSPGKGRPKPGLTPKKVPPNLGKQTLKGPVKP